MSPSQRDPRYDVQLSVDGEPAPLRAFVHDVFGGAILGMVQALRGCENAREVTIRVVQRQATTPGDTQSGPTSE
ncbi:MAG: hypothetical protein KDB53_11840 [Planctomycetes bacterium]|nr:hypothetical protein [Planctomycetota bacterium]